VVEAWYRHDRSQALAVASPGAVAFLFSHAFPAAGVQYRGCSTTPGQRSSDYCTYRWGAQSELLQLTVVRAKGGWAVTSASLLS